MKKIILKILTILIISNGISNIATSEDDLLERGAYLVTQSMEKMDAAFEFISKIGAPFYCFHDFDIANPAPSFLEKETEQLMDAIENFIKAIQKYGV